MMVGVRLILVLSCNRHLTRIREPRTIKSIFQSNRDQRTWFSRTMIAENAVWYCDCSWWCWLMHCQHPPEAALPLHQSMSNAAKAVVAFLRNQSIIFRTSKRYGKSVWIVLFYSWLYKNGGAKLYNHKWSCYLPCCRLVPAIYSVSGLSLRLNSSSAMTVNGTILGLCNLRRDIV